MRVVTQIRFVDENGEKFFGEGPCRLLRGIEETGSLRNAERALGFALTMRSAGGKDGGGSVLTPQGKEWLNAYEAYRDACIQANARLYTEFFPGER